MEKEGVDDEGHHWIDWSMIQPDYKKVSSVSSSPLMEVLSVYSVPLSYLQPTLHSFYALAWCDRCDDHDINDISLSHTLHNNHVECYRSLASPTRKTGKGPK
jgi:hypothetical protein